MSKSFNPIHWECSMDPAEAARVVDLRMLPEELKVCIIQAALQVGFRYHNGEYDIEEGSEEDEALAELSTQIERVRGHMYAVDLIHMFPEGS